MTAIVQCQRVGDIQPAAGSVVVGCVACRAAVWFHVGDRSLGAVAVYCPACVPRRGPLMFSPGQIDRLIAAGLDDNGIARMLAVARMTDGNPAGVPALAAHVAADPDAARRFDDTIATAAADLAEIHPTRMRRPALETRPAAPS
jgi:hypothetical protein